MVFGGAESAIDLMPVSFRVMDTYPVNNLSLLSMSSAMAQKEEIRSGATVIDVLLYQQ